MDIGNSPEKPQQPSVVGSDGLERVAASGATGSGGLVSAPEPTGFTVKSNVKKTVLFSILSIGIYSFYWFYVNRKRVTHALGTDDNAGLQTLGLIVPILNIFITYWLWRDINKLRGIGGLEELPVQSYVIGFIVLYAVATATANSSSSGLLAISLFAYVAIGFIYLKVLESSNEAWDAVSGGTATEAETTSNEKTVVAVGFVLLLAAFIGGFTVGFTSS